MFPLSITNPYILLGATIAAISLYGGGYYHGSENTKNKYEAAKVKGLEKAAEQGQQDTVAGAKTSNELAGDKRQIREAESFVGGSDNKPTVRVICPTVRKEEIKITPLETPKQIEEKQSETAIVYLSTDAQRMYDVSAKPSDIELRTRTYEGTAGTTVDEGFEKVIKPNNLKCAENTAQLKRILERIRDKQKIFSAKE